MSLTATARSTPGKLRQEIAIDGRHRLITDEPEHLGGEDGGPAPHELFPAALAACTGAVDFARLDADITAAAARVGSWYDRLIEQPARQAAQTQAAQTKGDDAQ